LGEWTLLDWATAALVVLVTIDWAAVLFLWRASRKARREDHRSLTLEDRGRTATLIAAASTIALLLGLNRTLHLIPNDDVLILLVVAVLLPSCANFIFMFDLWQGRFD
jgi:predicted metal-binding membrane protein